MNQMLEVATHLFKGIADKSNVEGMYSNYFIERQSAATPPFRIPHSDFRIRQMFHMSFS